MSSQITAPNVAAAIVTNSVQDIDRQVPIETEKTPLSNRIQLLEIRQGRLDAELSEFKNGTKDIKCQLESIIHKSTKVGSDTGKDSKEFWFQYVNALIIGTTSSAIFLIIVSRIKPEIVVSEHISCFNSKTSSEVGYAIKIINKTRWPIVEIKATLERATKKNLANGAITRTHSIQLVKAERFELPGFKRKTPEESAFRFVTYEKLQDILSCSDSYVVFTVHAKHSLTGFGKVARQEYFGDRDVIRQGSFKVGLSMDIVEQANSRQHNPLNQVRNGI